MEEYKDRICESLPGDYNNTAIRLKLLIGASDHMIQWILTGDMLKVNHRIYQVVLVYVCFEPHFIKFCDIMEALVTDSITVGYIVELRKSKCLLYNYITQWLKLIMYTCYDTLHTALIKQLYDDSFITAEEASRLTLTKLFTMPIPNTASLPDTVSVPSVDILCNNAMTNSSINTSNICTSSVPEMQNVLTDHNINTFMNEVPMGNTLTTVTKSMSSNVADDAITLAIHDQSEQSQHTPTGINFQPATVEFADREKSSTNASTISPDENDAQHTMLSLQQGTNAITATGTTDTLADSVLFYHISNESETEHYSISEAESLSAHNKPDTTGIKEIYLHNYS